MLLLHRKTRQATLQLCYRYISTCVSVAIESDVRVYYRAKNIVGFFYMCFCCHWIIIQLTCANGHVQTSDLNEEFMGLTFLMWSSNQPPSRGRTRQTLLGRPPHNRCCYQGGDHISRGPSQYSHYISPPILRVFSHLHRSYTTTALLQKKSVQLDSQGERKQLNHLNKLGQSNNVFTIESTSPGIPSRPFPCNATNTYRGCPYTSSRTTPNHVPSPKNARSSQSTPTIYRVPRLRSTVWLQPWHEQHAHPSRVPSPSEWVCVSWTRNETPQV